MFEHRNMNLIGIFDVSPAVIGRKVSKYTVMDMRELPAFAKEHPIDIAILTVPKEFAQDTAQSLANIGIKGIWNFTSRELDLKVRGIMVENVHMGDSMMRLMYEINNHEQLNET